MMVTQPLKGVQRNLNRVEFNYNPRVLGTHEYLRILFTTLQPVLASNTHANLVLVKIYGIYMNLSVIKLWVTIMPCAG